MVSYDEKALMINALGDEWGGGELWDLYESVENPKQFDQVFVYIICLIMFIVGCVMLGFYSKYTDKHYLLSGGAGLLVLCVIILIAYHFV